MDRSWNLGHKHVHRAAWRLRKLGTLIVLVLIAAASLQACGGRSTETLSDDHATGTGAGAGASSSSTGGGNSCLSRKVECVQASDCCSGICHVDPPPYDLAVDLETKTCVDCIRAGEPCQQGRDSACCARTCNHDNRCGCGGARSACRTDSDCCSFFCYVEKSTCLSVRCDPRLYPDVDLEQCWLNPEFP